MVSTIHMHARQLIHTLFTLTLKSKAKVKDQVETCENHNSILALIL